MADLPLKKIKFQPLEDQVYEQLQTAIMTGKIRQSDRLTVRALAKSIGTSEMPVRSALNRLTTEGALVKRASSGTTMLPQVTKPEFTEWMTLRALLEEQATVLAVPNLKTANIKRLESALAALDHA
ncbi:MAG: GntR family transcriptional regulator, partial [Pseudomonadota bacterium]